MKILHENGKLFGKISMVDILVIILAIMLIYGVYNRYTNTIIPKTNTESNKNLAKEFYYDTIIENVIPETAEMIKKDDFVYDKISGTKIGTVEEVKITDAKKGFKTKDGKIIESIIKGKVDITVKVKSYGNINDGKFLANYTIDILSGENRQFETKYVSLNSKVLDVYKVEE